MHDEPIPPPHAGGRNIDLRHLTAGSTLYLPVGVPGALLSLGDGHAAQGDGEVCVSTLECQVRTTIRVSIERSMSLRGGRCGLVGRSPGVACRTRAIVSETRRRVPRLRLSTN
jgi:acetamidase/formamidase